MAHDLQADLSLDTPPAAASVPACLANNAAPGPSRAAAEQLQLAMADAAAAAAGLLHAWGAQPLAPGEAQVGRAQCMPTCVMP